MPTAETEMCREFPVFWSFGATGPPLYRASARRDYETAVSVVSRRFDRRIGRAAVHFRYTSHDLTRIYNVRNDSLAPVRLICALILGKFTGEQDAANKQTDTSAEGAVAHHRICR
jgi:hypothetical protein